MATTEIVTITCDLNPEDGAATSHRLTLDGVTVDIDLCGECLDPLAGYLEGGQPARTAAVRQRTADIRAWAAAQGLTDKPRGRLPRKVVAAYDAAHQGESR